MEQSPFRWRRDPRSSFTLSHDRGVYALFLREGTDLPGVRPGEQGLLYIGLAANRKGLEGRCHFNARTRNHSPRKSLAVLLMERLGLTPVLVTKPNSADTWGLDAASEAKLTAWMHDNLDLATQTCPDPDSRETELVARYAPPLNLTKCVQSEQHRLISAARGAMLARLKAQHGTALLTTEMVSDDERSSKFASQSDTVAAEKPPAFSARHLAGADLDTAEAIAERYGLNPKSYRQRLRGSVEWYRKPQDWTFPVGSDEWHEMIAVAEKMGR